MAQEIDSSLSHVNFFLWNKMQCVIASRNHGGLRFQITRLILPVHSPGNNLQFAYAFWARSEPRHWGGDMIFFFLESSCEERQEKYHGDMSKCNHNGKEKSILGNYETKLTRHGKYKILLGGGHRGSRRKA